MLAALDPTLDPWRFQPHPQVWLLITALVGAYVYALKIIGPDAVRPGQQIVTRRQLMAFVGAMVGLERTVVPLIGEREFGLASKTAIVSFIVSFGVTKALLNLVAARLSERTPEEMATFDEALAPVVDAWVAEHTDFDAQALVDAARENLKTFGS